MSSEDEHNPFGDASPRVVSAVAEDAMAKLMAARSARLGGLPAAAPASSGGVGGGLSPPTSAHEDVTNPFGVGGASGGGGGGAAGGPVTPRPTWLSSGMQLTPDGEVDTALDELTGLPSEIQVFEKIRCMLRGVNGARVLGWLSASTYQIRFKPEEGSFPPSMRHLSPAYLSVPVGSVRKLERVPGTNTSPAGVELVCKDVRTLLFGFEREDIAEMIHMRLKIVAFPVKQDFLFAFSSVTVPKGQPALPQPGWDVYSPEEEIARLGVLDVRHPTTGESLFRVSDTNREYGFCPTYPATLVFPGRATDAFMAPVAEFRSKGRVPALTWIHPAAKTSLWRCSQPRVGMQNKKCAQDEEMLQMIRDNNLFTREGPRAPLLVADCRPQTNARANLAMGGGYENYPGTQLEFCNIHNIHAVRDSHRAVEKLVLSATPKDPNWSSEVASTNWLTHLRAVLSAGLRCAEAMHRLGQCVVVHCSDGWDRTAQVSCLVQVFLDPHARTLRGFCSLVAKEWCGFGHKFGERAGHALDKDDGDISPVFVQFCDAIAQLVRLFPHAFEFNARLPLLLSHHLYTCRFGTFLCNNERERRESTLQQRTPSLWGYILGGGEITRSLLSTSYDPSRGDVLLPYPSALLRNVTLWSDWFQRFSPYPSLSTNCAGMESYPEASYNRTHLEAARAATAAAAASPTGGPAAAASGAKAVVVAAAAAAAVAETAPAVVEAAAAAAAAVAVVEAPAVAAVTAPPVAVAAVEATPAVGDATAGAGAAPTPIIAICPGPVPVLPTISFSIPAPSSTQPEEGAAALPTSNVGKGEEVAAKEWSPSPAAEGEGGVAATASLFIPTEGEGALKEGGGVEEQDDGER